MKKIPLTQGKFALVDDENFEWLNQWKWCAVKHNNDKYYAVCNSETKTIYMHRLILGLCADDNIFTDHIDGNGLNNFLSNLRICKQKQNNYNKLKTNKTCSSKYKGVRKQLRRKPWRAQIQINGKCKYLGSFEKEIDAAKAYDIAAKKYFGNFACLNFAA